MSEMITRLQQLADRLAAEGETDAPTDIAMAVEQIEHLQKELELTERCLTVTHDIVCPACFGSRLHYEDPAKPCLECDNTGVNEHSAARVITRAVEHFRKGYINRSIHWQELQDYAKQLEEGTS